ncbi:hypothetical protein ALC56_11697 [Trachymyrmex septentrionalis]|uniref:Uncharacterized protein n=1 Tax=Trachymyrmex septentrionalis TaxID=34720 RepID=A0A195F1A5_9HYME|nr:hypothetical protein ALC56_11697 [Trachymyrmex septentrionalis]
MFVLCTACGETDAEELEGRIRRHRLQTSGESSLEQNKTSIFDFFNRADDFVIDKQLTIKKDINNKKFFCIQFIPNISTKISMLLKNVPFLRMAYRDINKFNRFIKVQKDVLNAALYLPVRSKEADSKGDTWRSQSVHLQIRFTRHEPPSPSGENLVGSFSLSRIPIRISFNRAQKRKSARGPYTCGL